MLKTNTVYSLFYIILFSYSLFTTACNNTKPPFKCTDNINCVEVTPGGPVNIGVLQALSGKIAPLGQEQIRGMELAIDKWQGKIKGHSIVLVTEDTGCTGEGGANASLKLIANPQIVAIFGTTCSGAARTASHAMSRAGLTMISGNNSAPFLTSIGGKPAPDWHPGYFRTANNEENAGKTAAVFAFQKLNIRKVATINDGDIYTKGLTEGFRHAFKALGGEIVLNTSVNKGDIQMKPVLTAVINSRAELLFFPLFQPEGNHILLQSRKTPGFRNIIMMSDGALIEKSFIEAVQDFGKGMYFVGPSRPTGPAVEALSAKYNSKYGFFPATSYYLNAYDAACLLIGAIEKISVIEQGQTLHIGRQALRNALYATKGFQGVTGRLSCDEFGDCSIPSFNVLRLDDPAAGVEGLQSNAVYSYTAEQ